MPNRYVIYGAGGIGCTIGARLFASGREVVLIARGPHLEAIRERGLTLKTPPTRSSCASPRSPARTRSTSARTTSSSSR